MDEMSYEKGSYNIPFSRYLIMAIFFKESQFQPFPLGLDMYFIWKTNRKLHIPVKMSYETSLYGMPFSRYRNLAESALFCKI